MGLRSPSLHRMMSFAFVTAALAGSVAWAIDGSVRESLDDMRLFVSAHFGAVELKTDGIEQIVSVGAIVGLPARIVTGADGNLGIRQQRTSIAIAADSDVEIPESVGQGQLIARLIQHRGNVFYDVETRPANKLNVETPYLVAVVKGTQFNISVDDERTMVSLFEGQLEIRTPDASQTIDLEAGEIAIRSRTDGAIRVVSMNAVVEQGRTPFDTDELAGAVEAPVERVALDGVADFEPVDGGLAAGLDLSRGTNVGGDLSVGLGAGVDMGATGGAGLGLDVGADLGAGSVDLGLDTGADLGAGSVDLGLDAGADLGAGSVDLGLDTGAGLGAGSVDLGVEATLDLGLEGSGIDPGAELTTEPLVDPSGAGLPDLTPDNEQPGQSLPPVPSL